MTSSKSISRTAPSVVSDTVVASSMLIVQTPGAGFVDLTREVAKFIGDTGAREGALTIFIRHTSASLTIQENADADVQADLLDALDRLAPAGPIYRHSIEGPDDMPAHIKTVLTATSQAIPVLRGQLMLGTWQGLYVVEHRARPHTREVVLHFSGTRAVPPGRSSIGSRG